MLACLQNGLAEIERRSNSWDRRGAVKILEKFQAHAKKERRGICCVRGTDVPDESARDGEACDANDDDDLLPPARAQPPSRGFDLIGLIASKTTCYDRAGLSASRAAGDQEDMQAI